MTSVMCPNCGSLENKSSETPYMIHYGKITCLECDRFIKWIENPNKDERTKTSKFKEEKIAEYFELKELRCFFCGRFKEELGIKETMTIDHIKPLSEGGRDEIRNLQILCTACHKLKNWSELYMRKHFVKEDD